MVFRVKKVELKDLENYWIPSDCPHCRDYIKVVERFSKLKYLTIRGLKIYLLISQYKEAPSEYHIQGLLITHERKYNEKWEVK